MLLKQRIYLIGCNCSHPCKGSSNVYHPCITSTFFVWQNHPLVMENSHRGMSRCREVTYDCNITFAKFFFPGERNLQNLLLTVTPGYLILSIQITTNCETRVWRETCGRPYKYLNLSNRHVFCQCYSSAGHNRSDDPHVAHAKDRRTSTKRINHSCGSSWSVLPLAQVQSYLSSSL